MPPRLIAICTLMIGAIAAPALAQDTADRSIDQFLCRDVMRESGPNRDVAIAFLHGYLLGKADSVRFNLDRVRQESDAFVERCLDNPGEKAIDGMTRVKTVPR